MSENTSMNFIEGIITDELERGVVDHVATRFPPEPNGYLHIGHAKSLCINFGMKEKFHGTCNLRYDDTNPTKEDVEYVESIKADIAWLGFSWDRELFASDYFDDIYAYAEKLIEKGLAFVCDMSADEIRESRGTLTEPGRESPYRYRSVEENLRLFREMRNGNYGDGEKVLRAKIDMSSPNINMRDPVIYRILRAHHHRTGDKWLIYPMYDFAHPLSDAIEGITHSICTLEFEDHRPLYDWVKYNCGFSDNPRQIEFARLNITQTIMSKRYLKKLVDNGVVDGWDDPRMPTLAGMRKRGYPAPAIRDFCDRIGVAKANSEVNVNLLEHCIREYLNTNANRLMVVEKPLLMIIDNFPDDKSEEYELVNNPNCAESGTHTVTFSKRIYIEQSDFEVTPPPKYHRLTVGGMVRLKGSYIVKYVSHECDERGLVTAVHTEYIEDSREGGVNAGIKVKGVIHWADAVTAVPVTLNKFDYLLVAENEGADFSERLNPASKQVVTGAMAEAAVLKVAAYDKFQFMRSAYYMAVDGYNPKAPQFNMIVGLKDGYKA